MNSKYIGTITLLVNNYDEAIDFYTNKVGFKLIEDTKRTSTKRWVIISPSPLSVNCTNCNLLLTKAISINQKSTVGKQAGDSVFLFYFTDNFQRDYKFMKNNNVIFLEEPRNEKYGIVVKWKDIYGNKWDLIQSKS